MAFISSGTPIYLEAKFRPTDWMRTPGCGGEAVDEGFFREIGHKFPSGKSAFRKCVAAITGFAEPITGIADADNSFFALCEKKLLLTPGLDAILYRSMLGPIYVCGLDKDVVAQVAPLIRFPEFREYPPCYPVLFNRKLREERATVKKQTRLPEQGLFSPLFLTINQVRRFSRNTHIAAAFRNAVAKENRTFRTSRRS